MSSLLATRQVSNLDIRSTVEILSFRYVYPNPASFSARVLIDNIAGNSDYTASLFVNGKQVLPEYPISVGDVRDFAAQTSQIIIIENDEISIRLKGTSSDTNVLCTIHLIDMNPDISTEQINTIVNALSNVTVSPERAVLAPLNRQANTERVMLGPVRQPVVSFDLPLQ